MKSLLRSLLLAAGLGLALTTLLHGADAPAKKKVLFFTKSSGFEHDGIKLAMKDGRPGFAFTVLSELGAKNNIEFTFSKDGSLFTPEYLAQFDAFMFYTSGRLTERRDLKGRGDDNPLMTAAGKAAFLQAVSAGKGFVGVHSADDSFHAPGDDETGPIRHTSDYAGADPYIKMLGGEFVKHGAQQTSHVIVADPKFPGIDAIPAGYGPLEEWYTNKNFSPDLHVILATDTAGMTGSEYARAPYPSTWARLQGKGRVFYTSMGHREDIWTSAPFQSMLLGGLNWALRRIDADVTPNIDKVTPQANVLQKYVPPPPPEPKADTPAAK